MRRKEKQMPSEVFEDTIKKCEVIHLALHDEPAPYIVPLNFGYRVVNGSFVFYLHCASEGKKLELIRKNPNVGFELETDVEIIIKEEASQITTKYKSIIGTGVIEFAKNSDEKIHALNNITERVTGVFDNKYPDAVIEKVTVFKLIVSSIDGKISNG